MRSITDLSEGSQPAPLDRQSRFQSELPLHPAAAEFLGDAFARGWASPAKIHQESRKTALLLNEAKEIFLSHLGLRAEELNFLGETPLGFHLGISGFATETTTVYYPATSRAMAHAVAQSHHCVELPVDRDGYFHTPPNSHSTDILVWQAVNPESGLIAREPVGFAGKVFVDSVNSPTEVPTWEQRPQEESSWSSAIWDSRAWQGPAGLSIFGLRDRTSWRNPLPHNDSKPTSGNFSIPLAIASAIALDHFTKDYAAAKDRLDLLNAQIRSYILHNFPGSEVAASFENSVPHLLSFSIPEVDSQWLINELDIAGFAVDTGSACISMNMQPSHVLAAMGLPVTGNIRLRLQNTHTESDLQELLARIKLLSQSFAD